MYTVQCQDNTDLLNCKRKQFKVHGLRIAIYKNLLPWCMIYGSSLVYTYEKRHLCILGENNQSLLQQQISSISR